jgi:flagellar protein FlaF
MYQQSQEHTSSYTTAQKGGLSQKEMEIRAFISTASSFNRIKEHWDEEKDSLPEALEKNRLLWTVIVSSLKEADNPQPENIKRSIIQLAAFVFKRTLDLMGDPRPEGLDVLININMNIARGLGGNASD